MGVVEESMLGLILDKLLYFVVMKGNLSVINIFINSFFFPSPVSHFFMYIFLDWFWKQLENTQLWKLLLWK